MKKMLILLAVALSASVAGHAGPLGAPLGILPRVELPKVNLPELPVDDITGVVGSVRELAQVRLQRLDGFVRTNRRAVEYDMDRQPSVKGVLIATGVDDSGIAAATGAGFILSSREEIDGLGLDYVRFNLPKGMSLNEGEKRLRALLPDAEIDADNIYFTSGNHRAPAISTTLLASANIASASLGLIDGGVADHPSIAGRVEQKGFVTGAPRASSHGTSVAALMIGTGSVNGGLPGGTLLAADVYGTDKAGGNATSIARALGWMATRKVPVVAISLVGPDNGLLSKAISSAQGKGMIIVAAVGNDGPAAPKAYPASYHGVLAVTGVDGNDKVLPEAGRTSQVAFAAPGAGITSATGAKSTSRVRGTSFAVPLVAGRLAYHYRTPSISGVEPGVRKLITEAIDLGKAGVDPVYGHGLICGKCIKR